MNSRTNSGIFLCPYISIIRAITGFEGPASSNARKVCFMTLDTPIGAYFV